MYFQKKALDKIKNKGAFELIVYNMLGSEIYRVELSEYQLNSIMLDNLSNGLHLFNIMKDGETYFTQKVNYVEE